MCPYDLGIFGYCALISIGLRASQTGLYTFYIFMNGKRFIHTKSYVIDDLFTLDPYFFNPNSRVMLNIVNPDDSVYTGYLEDFTLIPNTEFELDIQVITTLPIVNL